MQWLSSGLNSVMSQKMDLLNLNVLITSSNDKRTVITTVTGKGGEWGDGGGGERFYFIYAKSCFSEVSSKGYKCLNLTWEKKCDSKKLKRIY